MFARLAAISALVIILILFCVFQFVCFVCDSFTPRSFSLLQDLGGVAGVASEPRAISTDPHVLPRAVVSVQTHNQLPPASSIIRHKLAKQIQGSSTWSSLKVREMVARLFRAVADMDLRVTHKNEEMKTKLAVLQRTVLAGSPESHHSGRTHAMDAMLSVLSVLRSQVSAESERLDILNSTQKVQTSNLRNSLGTLETRMVSDDANIKKELKNSQLGVSRQIKMELSGIEERVAAEQQAAKEEESKQAALASDLQTALARLHKLVAAMHTKVDSVDRAVARSGARNSAKFTSLQGSIDAADGMIESMKKELSSRSRESDDDSKRHEETARALAREVAKARLREKAEAARVAALRTGLEVVEGDETLLHDQEKAIRSAVAQQAQEERAVKSRVDAADGRFQHLSKEVSGVRVWARNQSRFDSGLDQVVAALPHHLALMVAEARHASLAEAKHSATASALRTDDASEAHVHHRHRAAADSARRRHGDEDSDGKSDDGGSRRREERRHQEAGRHEDRQQHARRDLHRAHRRHAARQRNEEKSKKEGKGKRGQEADAECLVKGSSGGCVVKKGGRADCIVPGLDGGCIVRKLFSRKTG